MSAGRQAARSSSKTGPAALSTGRLSHLIDVSSAHLGLDNISTFTVDPAGQIHYLRRRGANDVPSAIVRRQRPR